MFSKHRLITFLKQKKSKKILDESQLKKLLDAINSYIFNDMHPTDIENIIGKELAQEFFQF